MTGLAAFIARFRAGLPVRTKAHRRGDLRWCLLVLVAVAMAGGTTVIATAVQLTMQGVEYGMDGHIRTAGVTAKALQLSRVHVFLSRCRDSRQGQHDGQQQ